MKSKRVAQPASPLFKAGPIFKTGAISIALAVMAGCASGPGPAATALAGPGRAPASIPTLVAAQTLDDGDQTFMVPRFNKAMESTLTGQQTSWTNPSGYLVQITPTRTYQQANNTYCRDFTQTLTLKDRAQTSRGAACRGVDGSWQIVG